MLGNQCGHLSVTVSSIFRGVSTSDSESSEVSTQLYFLKIIRNLVPFFWVQRCSGVSKADDLCFIYERLEIRHLARDDQGNYDDDWHNELGFFGWPKSHHVIRIVFSQHYDRATIQNNSCSYFAIT